MILSSWHHAVLVQTDRWAFNTLEDALAHAKMRNSQAIRVVLDPMIEDVADVGQLEASYQEHVRCLNVIRANGLYASLALKLSALGMNFDEGLCRERLIALADEGLKRSIQLEIDMEGKKWVDFTIDSVIAVADEGYRATLAVQAYLDRTPKDIAKLVKEGVTVRLVKGAYLGDTNDFDEIQRRMISISDGLLGKKRFCIGTHDPVIIERLQSKAQSKKYLEFGFLMGLSDTTKYRLSTGEWNVVEYVPYGSDSSAYVKRREIYLKRLKELGKDPAP
ncbi:MAG: Proline dehydrogenase [Methanomassiliicoccales archaeon PtaU1.Bin124]|nr:MAG: Proline dehydrogenase [Methanomassiliicoccales archaeon PtaU1.Bin124]